MINCGNIILAKNKFYFFKYPMLIFICAFLFPLRGWVGAQLLFLLFFSDYSRVFQSEHSNS